ncbi:TetR/AcrR family transcriptional regulator [Streptomyces acidicola]|uniref:TetR family transcriptional regulator n=1 Tax=Streptomyces acidicola TaxID=2596892 RepID=A0A5N8WYW1_9ACTN|nr:TetR/AcrR family transcriptional regulator [Streptomyces acidicola]MPY51956.1 TetR family transcriptional regulator [Streptomyces acidicola]
MRPSSRNLILDAAIRVTERDGITGLTLESAAEEAGVTKGGLMYHFRTRDDLLLAIQKHLTAAWEEQLDAELGKPLAEASARETVEAYARVGTRGTAASKADLAFMLESVTQPELSRVWEQMMRRWSPPLRSAEPAEIDLLLARLATDGLWLFEATSGYQLPAPIKKALGERLVALTRAEDGDDA